MDGYPTAVAPDLLQEDHVMTLLSDSIPDTSESTPLVTTEGPPKTPDVPA